MKILRLFLLVLVLLALSFPALAVDDFAGRPAVSKVVPATDGYAITPHDTNELSHVCRGVWVGGAGNLKVTLVGSGTLTLYSVQAGTLVPISPKIVFSTGTTATNLDCLY